MVIKIQIEENTLNIGAKMGKFDRVKLKSMQSVIQAPAYDSAAKRL